MYKDTKELLATTPLKKELLEQTLVGGLKHPAPALRRLKKGESELTISQLCALADAEMVSPEDLLLGRKRVQDKMLYSVGLTKGSYYRVGNKYYLRIYVNNDLVDAVESQTPLSEVTIKYYLTHLKKQQ